MLYLRTQVYKFIVSKFIGSRTRDSCYNIRPYVRTQDYKQSKNKKQQQNSNDDFENDDNDENNEYNTNNKRSLLSPSNM